MDWDRVGLGFGRNRAYTFIFTLSEGSLILGVRGVMVVRGEDRRELRLEVGGSGSRLLDDRLAVEFLDEDYCIVYYN